MKNNAARNLSLVAAAVAVGLGSVSMPAQSQDDSQTQEVRRAAQELERAEERLDSAEEAVEEQEEELEAAIVEAAGADQRDSSERSSSARWDASDWDELTEEHEDLGIFVEALRITGLDDTLTDGTSYTVFAPVDEAFEELDDDLLSEGNREELIELLRAHIVADDVDPDRARTLREALTVDGGTVDVSVEDGELMIGDARVVEYDIGRGNLRIYAIDKALESSVSSLAFGD